MHAESIKRTAAALALASLLLPLDSLPADSAEAQLFEIDRLAGVGGSFDLRPTGGFDDDRRYALASGSGTFRFVHGGIEIGFDALNINWAQRCAAGKCKGPVRAALVIAGRHRYSSGRDPGAVLGFAPIPLAADNAPVELPANAAGTRVFVPLPGRVALAETTLMVKIGKPTVLDDGYIFASEYAWIGESGRGEFAKALAQAGLGPDPCADLLDPVKRREIGCRRAESE